LSFSLLIAQLEKEDVTERGRNLKRRHSPTVTWEKPRQMGTERVPLELRGVAVSRIGREKRLTGLLGQRALRREVRDKISVEPG